MSAASDEPARPSIRRYLTTITLATVLPFLLLATGAGVYLVHKERETFKRGSVERVRALGAAVDAELRSSITTLQAVAHLISLKNDDDAVLRSIARGLLADNRDWIRIELVDAQTRVTLVRESSATKPPWPNNLEWASVAEAVRSRRPVIGDVSIDLATSKSSIALRIPVQDSAQRPLVLTALVDPAAFQRILDVQGIAANWTGVVLDRQMRFVARTVRPQEMVGRMSSESLRQGVASQPDKVFVGKTLEGVEVYTPFFTSSYSGWTVALGVPTAEVDAAGLTLAWTAMLAALLVGFGAIALAHWLSRNIATPLEQLAAHTRALGTGEEAPAPMSRQRVAEVEQLRHIVNQAGVLARARHKSIFDLVERAPFGLYIVDADLRIAMMNEAARDGAFANTQPAIGKPLVDVLGIVWPPQVAADIRERFRHTLESGEPYISRDFVNRRADVDRLESYEWELHQIDFADGRKGVICYYFDSTAVRATERALSEATAELRQMLQTAATGLTRCSRDLRYLTANPAYAEIVGRPLEEIVGRGIVDVLGEQALAGLRGYIERVLSGERVEYETSITLPASTPKVLHVVYSPWMEADGAVSGWVASVFDVTARKHAEDALREAAQRKDEFLATLAHELRNPLAPVRNAIQIMKAKGTATAQIEWARDVIDRQMRQMSRLIDDLMDASRISRGRIRLERQRIDIAQAVAQAVEMCRPSIEASKHALSVDVATGQSYVDADPTRLVQILCNLIDNAAKYTDPGGHIALRATEEVDEAVISVSDDGIGIAADMLVHIFDMFTQGDRAVGGSRGGLGIGLSLAKRLTEMHGGRLEVRSEGAGKGSAFTLRLPLAGAPSRIGEPSPDAAMATAASTTALPSPRTENGSPPRVLVVDDNRDAAQSLDRLLQINGYDVRTACDGLDAVRVAEAFQPAAAIVDIELPRLSGHEVARAIRGAPWGRRTLLIALTGRGQHMDRRKSLDAGFDRHVVKSSDPQEILELLRGKSREQSLRADADLAEAEATDNANDTDADASQRFERSKGWL